MHVEIIMQIFPLSFSLPLTLCLHTLWLVYHLRFTTITNNLLRCLLLLFIFYFGLLTHICNVIAWVRANRQVWCTGTKATSSRKQRRTPKRLFALCLPLSLSISLCMCVHVYACLLQSIFTFLTNYQFSALCCAVDKSSLAARRQGQQQRDADANANVDSQRFCGSLRVSLPPPLSCSCEFV